MSVVGSSSRLDVQQAVPLARRQFSAARKDSLPIASNSSRTYRAPSSSCRSPNRRSCTPSSNISTTSTCAWTPGKKVGSIGKRKRGEEPCKSEDVHDADLVCNLLGDALGDKLADVLVRVLRLFRSGDLFVNDDGQSGS